MKVLKYFIATIILAAIVNVAFAKNLTVESKKQVYDESKKLITLEKEVKVTVDDVNVRSPKAFLTINQAGKPDTATFVEGAHAIQVTKNSKSETKANILKLSLISKEVEATGNVESKIEKLGKPTVTIKSDYQSFNTETNLMEAKENVVMTYDDIKTNSDSAKIWLSKKGGLEHLKLIGNAKVMQDKIVVSGSEVNLDANTEVLTSAGSTYTNVKIDDASTVKIWAYNQQYNNKTNTAMASGAVKIIYNDYVATGPKAVMLADPKTHRPNKIIFSGRSKIKEGDKSIEADSIVITMNPKNFTAEGNVKTQINNLENLDSGNKGR